jgi:class III poly(R)-hydroxyalkanoic acid synthase PhaE subunit
MSDPVNVWLAAQREMTERWLATSAKGGAQDPTTLFWQAVAQGLSPKARDLAQQLSALGPGFIAGAGDALFELFGGGVGAGANKPTEQPFGRWLDLAPIGYFREHHAHAQELARALAEYQRIAAQMTAAIAKIHAEGLERLAKKAEELAKAGEPVTDTRRLYALWIECGEQAFAQQARGEVFGLLQGELVNAGTRVRMAQQTIAENFMKSLDLPTRAELNSVHKRLKEMRERIEELEAQKAERGER